MLSTHFLTNAISFSALLTPRTLVLQSKLLCCLASMFQALQLNAALEWQLFSAV